jgi:hypothetical protein
MSSQLASTSKNTGQHEPSPSAKAQFTPLHALLQFRRAMSTAATAKAVGAAEHPHRPLAHAARATRRRALLVCLGAGVTALSPVNTCLSGQLADALSAPTSAGSRCGQGLATIYWNQLARELVGSQRVDPPRASRLYAILSIAQHDAAILYQGAKGATSSGTEATDYLQRARIEGASHAVLTELLHGNLDYISQFRFRDSFPTRTSEELESAYQAGRAIALRLLKERRGDGSDDAGEAASPTGPYAWRSRGNEPPVRPRWGYVRPLTVREIEDFVPVMPSLDAKSLGLALDEVRRASSDATAHERELVRAWADGAGTSTPPGHWNAIAAGLIAERRLSELAAAQTLSLLNIALMDAGIACWRTKYTYWLARPNQLDPNIKPLIAAPNFPSFTSGHSAFSSAAAKALGHIFREEKVLLREMAEQAARSRLYGGIHFGFDVKEGLLQGERIANAAIDRYWYLSPLLPRIL